ncbi:MAG: hypothetical protein PHP50_03675 [Lachnospiraceae bacterium]|nr:hypothetical protein [Lachnospiraceae bacterium]
MIRKICFTASSGGHLEEISRLTEIRYEYDGFLFTEAGNFQELNFCENVIYAPQINRFQKDFWIQFIKFFSYRQKYYIKNSLIALFRLARL